MGKQLAAIVFFNIMLTAIILGVVDFVVAVHYTIVDDDALDVSLPFVFGIIALVFLGLWLSVKRKGHVY